MDNNYCKKLINEKKILKSMSSFIDNFVNKIKKMDKNFNPSKYCGINFIMEILPFLQIKKTNKILIIDGMNIIRNVHILYMSLLLINYFKNKDEIYKIIIAMILTPETIVFKNLMFLINTLIPLLLILFKLDNYNIYIIYQSNDFDYKPYIHNNMILNIKNNLKNTDIYFIGIPCYINDNNKLLTCNKKKELYNEADDIALLFLYEYFKNKILIKNDNINIWSYDNYNWFTISRKLCILNLTLIINKLHKITDFKYELTFETNSIYPNNSIKLLYNYNNSIHIYSAAYNNINIGFEIFNQNIAFSYNILIPTRVQRKIKKEL